MLIETANSRHIPHNSNPDNSWLVSFFNDQVHNAFYKLRRSDQHSFVDYPELVLSRAAESVVSTIPENYRDKLVQTLVDSLAYPGQLRQPDSVNLLKHNYLAERLERQDEFWTPKSNYRYSAIIQ